MTKKAAVNQLKDRKKIAQAAGRPEATITIWPENRLARISPLVYGQFIEHLGRCINGGLFEEGSSLSDGNGFRKDVLEKARRLAPPILRWPGGTFTKIYHWMDGVGLKTCRPRRPNLIWGGEEDNHFGTDEYILYCRAIGAEPFITVNMATASAEEAGNWVEYCNGAGNTSYANLRRAHGFAEPHAVKVWALGNEEDAGPDCGRLQDPKDYIAEAWQFAKLMKLQDPTIRLVAAGTFINPEWNEKVIRALHPVCDYFSLHAYIGTSPRYGEVFTRLAGLEQMIERIGGWVRSMPTPVEGFSFWHRFPPRQGPMMIAMDEWGIGWDGGEQIPPSKDNNWNLDVTYTWKDALAVACFLNMFHRQADLIGMATLAQMVNVLAPILTSEKASICQTIFYPLELYAKHCGGWSVEARCESPRLEEEGAGECLSCLDLSATWSEERRALMLAVVNRHPQESIRARVELAEGSTLKLRSILEANAPAWDSKNSLARPGKDCVTMRPVEGVDGPTHPLAPHSITFLEYVENT